MFSVIFSCDFQTRHEMCRRDCHGSEQRRVRSRCCLRCTNRRCVWTRQTCMLPSPNMNSDLELILNLHGIHGLYITDTIESETTGKRTEVPPSVVRVTIFSKTIIIRSQCFPYIDFTYFFRIFLSVVLLGRISFWLNE